MRYRFMRFPEGKAKALTLSYDDGGLDDRKLIEIADRYGIRVTLNINSEMLGFEPYGRLNAQQLRELVSGGRHEIAVHGANHLALGKVAAVDGIRDVLHCREDLEKEFGGVIRGMAYADSGITKPSEGVTLPEIRTYLKSLGIAYARTLGGDNNSYRLPEDFWAWMPTAHHDNPQLMQWLEEFLSAPMPPWGDNQGPTLFYLWGHSFEFERNQNWDRFEQFCSKAGGHDNVWYATNIQICDYVNAYRALQWSVDCKRVFNPTCTPVWFQVNKQIICAQPGQLTTLA